MTQREIQRNQIHTLAELLGKADTYSAGRNPNGYEEELTIKAEYLYGHDVEVREKAQWLKDTTYTGNNKDIYACSHCLHWQAIKRMQREQIMYMKYCPFCGAHMSVKENEVCRNS